MATAGARLGGKSVRIRFDSGEALVLDETEHTEPPPT